MDRRKYLKLLSVGGIAAYSGCGENDSTTPTEKNSTTPTEQETSQPPDTQEEGETEQSRSLVELPWEQLPGPPGGPITDISVSAADSSYIYSTTITAGMFASSDRGASWTQGKGAMHHRHRVWASPHDPAIAYSQERTADGGRSWYGYRTPEKHLYPPVDGQIGVTDIAWDPSDEETIYATTNQGFYRTTDGGQSWEASTIDTESETEIERITVNPQTNGEIYAGVSSRGIAKSTDRGESWSIVSATEETVTHDVFGVQFGNNDAESVYYAINGGGVYRLSNGSVTELTVDLPDLAFPYWTEPLRVSSSGDALYFVAGPIGEDWWQNRHLYMYDSESRQIETIETPEEPAVVETDPNDPDTIYVGGISWVYRSMDRGETWDALPDGFIDGSLATVATNPTEPGVVIPGSLCSSGLSVSRDTGETYSWKRSGLSPWHEDKFGEHYLMQITALEDRAYATTSSGLLVSSDNGESWRLLDNEFSGQGDVHSDAPYAHLHGLAVDPEDPQVVYVGTGRGGAGAETGDLFDGTILWKSSDGGDSWSEITNGFPTDEDTVVQDVVVNPHSPATVYVGTNAEDYNAGGSGPNSGDGLGMFRSTDSASSWESLDTPFRNIHAISVDASGADMVYASTPGGVYRSENGGDEWEAVLEERTKALLAHPTQPGVVFAGSQTDDDYWDVLVTEDSGNTWANGNLTIQVGLEPDEREYDGAEIHSDYWNDNGEIMWFAIDETNKILYGAIAGVGLWSAEVSTLG